VEHESEALSRDRGFDVVRRRAPLIAICVVLVAAAAYGFSKHQTKKYKATASIQFSVNSLSEQIAGLPGGNLSTAALAAQQASNVERVSGGDLASQTARALDHGLTPEAVAASVSVASQGESGGVNVSATTTGPRLSAAVANTYAQIFVKEQQKANREYFKSALAIVHKQLSKLSPSQRVGPAGIALVTRAETLNLLAELDYGNVQVAQRAVPPSSSSSPKTPRNTALGVLLGLVLGLGLAFLLERLDRRIKTPEDLAEIYNLPLLGAVPKTASLARQRVRGGKRGVLPPAEAEAFGLIRAHLRFFNIDRELSTVLVASAAPGDGKTTVARHLAEAATGLGSRVLLLEADLRHPTLAQQLDIQPGPGLADVLIGATPIAVATQSVPLPDGSDADMRERTLDVLAAGAVLPPNPAALIESAAMDAVLAHARSVYDLVVIDTPPLTAVSDAFPLLTKVDGVVIVGWIGRSRRDSAQNLHRVLASSGTPLLGVIANGSKLDGTTEYASPRSKTPPATFDSPDGDSRVHDDVRATNA
jgi:capsular exopolysaccharide synthesis family protein